jgi:uracil-DNA glycosylase family 4
MAQSTSAADFLPDRLNLSALRQAADHCKGCDLYLNATQTVFGEGPNLLDEAIVEAGLDRKDVYITNAVKHFRWEPRGKRRLHKKPSARQINACRPWLEAEMTVIKPEVVVCLGATAAQALIGRDFRISRQRGEFLVSPWTEWTLATHHPSAVLRAPEKQDRVRMRGELIDDLHLVSKRLSALHRKSRAVKN